MKNTKLEDQFEELSDMLVCLTSSQVERWVKEEKIDYMSRQQRYLKALLLTNTLISKITPPQQTLLESIIIYNGYIKKKTEEYMQILYYFKNKDYEAQFILNILTEVPYPKKKALLYAKTRSVTLNTYKAKNNKDYLASISYNEEEWFNIISSVFSQVEPKRLVVRFSEGAKQLYRKEVKSQNSDMNGADILQLNIVYLLDLYDQSRVKRTTDRSLTPKRQMPTVRGRQISMTSSKSPSIPSYKPVKQVVDSRQSELINKITIQMQDLRGALGRQKSRIVQLSEREKYFMSFIGKVKEEFCRLAVSLQAKPSIFDQYQLLDPLFCKFKQYDNNIYHKQTPELKELHSRQQELKLIKQIEKQENNIYGEKNKFD